MGRSHQGEKGRKRWEDVAWLVRAVTAGNSHCTGSFGKQTLGVDTGGAADFSTGWPGGMGRGQSKGFLPGLGSRGRKEQGSVEGHSKPPYRDTGDSSVPTCATPPPAQHPAGTGPAPNTASNFCGSFTALT